MNFLKLLYLAWKLTDNEHYQDIEFLSIIDSGKIDNTPYVALQDGTIFFGHFPSDKQRYYYKYFLHGKTKKILKEGCINVAYDINSRYIIPGGNPLNWSKYYELTKDDIVLEIGAYTGYYAMRTSQKVKHVICIEAMVRNADIIRKNIVTNGIKNIIVIDRAAWSSKGVLSLYDNYNQQVSVSKKIAHNTQRRVYVKSDLVDNMVTGGSPTFVRIQVNGAELEVLKGMDRILKSKPKILVAVLYKNKEEIRALLGRYGYVNIIEIGGSLYGRF